MSPLSRNRALGEQLGAGKPEAATLQASDYLPDEPSFDGVRLANDQSALELFGSHKGARIAAFEPAGQSLSANSLVGGLRPRRN